MSFSKYVICGSLILNCKLKNSNFGWGDDALL